MDLTLKDRNPANGRFKFTVGDDGDVSFDDTEAHAVVTSVVEREGGYWANPSHGSKLGQLKSLTQRTPSQAEAMVLDALSSLERDGAIANVRARARTDRQRGILLSDADWTTPAGAPQSATVEV